LARRLTKLDEWPLHQTIDTFAKIASDSPNWSDGYWNCVGDPEGRVNLITAIRFYANTDVVDGYACITLDDGKQYNLRCSRRLRPRIDEIDAGPLWMEIVEGLRTFRFGCRENPHGIEFDLLWQGSAPAWDETPGNLGVIDGRLHFSRSNYVQIGHVSGTIKVGDREFQVGPGWVGARDHSWGIGGTGSGLKVNPHAAPRIGASSGEKRPSFGMRQWALVRFPKRSIFYWFHRSEQGQISPFSTHIGYPFEVDKPGSAYRKVEVVSHECVDSLRRLHRCELAFARYDGKTDRFAVETVSRPLYMQGGGYWGGFNDGLGRGVWRGEEHVEGDVWDVSHPTRVCDESGAPIPQRQGAWAETFARFENLDDPSEVGLGLLECVIGGPYPGVTEED
jgi:hypothetical protein